MESYDGSGEESVQQMKVPTWEELGPAMRSWKEPALDQRRFRNHLRALRRAEAQQARQPSTYRPHQPVQPERQ
jgi:hypothetical protein